MVLRGSGRMKVDDEIVELKEWDAVRVPPGTWRGYEAGPEGLEILVIGAPNLGEDPREDVDGQRDWWADVGVETVVWTDGSCNADGMHGRGGWAALIEQAGTVREISGSADGTTHTAWSSPRSARRSRADWCHRSPH